MWWAYIDSVETSTGCRYTQLNERSAEILHVAAIIVGFYYY